VYTKGHTITIIKLQWMVGMKYQKLFQQHVQKCNRNNTFTTQKLPWIHANKNILFPGMIKLQLILDAILSIANMTVTEDLSLSKRSIQISIQWFPSVNTFISFPFNPLLLFFWQTNMLLFFITPFVIPVDFHSKISALWIVFKFQ